MSLDAARRNACATKGREFGRFEVRENISHKEI